MPIALVEDNTIYYYHVDHLNTPIALTDGQGNPVWRGELEPFGAVTTMNNPKENPLRFPGQYADLATGLYYNDHRDYDPTLGRYLQPDPIGLRGGMNMYAYVYNNPLRYTDPYGLFGVEDMPTLPQWMVDVSAGVGDSASLGVTNLIRDALGTNSVVDQTSGAYIGGEIAGIVCSGGVASLRGAAAFGGTRLGNSLLNSNRYLRIGPGRMPANRPFPASTNAPRISIGPGPNNPHIDLRIRGVD